MRRRYIFHLALHFARLLEETLSAELSGCGLSPDQARYVDALAIHGPVSISALAAGLHVSQPSATNMVSRLEAAGLVSRAADPADARTWLVSLTTKGSRAASRATEAWDRVEARIRRELSPEDAAAFHDTLKHLRNRFGGRSPTQGSGSAERRGRR